MLTINHSRGPKVTGTGRYLVAQPSTGTYPLGSHSCAGLRCQLPVLLLTATVSRGRGMWGRDLSVSGVSLWQKAKGVLGPLSLAAWTRKLGTPHRRLRTRS